MTKWTGWVSTIVLIAVLGCEPKGTADFGPYLMSLATDSVIVCWRTKDKATAKVEYGLTAALGSVKEVSATSYQHEIKLDGLAAASVYHYKVTSFAGGVKVFESAVHSFKTAKPPVAAFKFAHMSDVHSNPNVAEYVAEIDAFGAEFIFDTGDQVSEGNSIPEWAEYFNQGLSVYSKRGLFPTFGNHQYMIDKFPYIDPKAETAMEVFANPGAEKWYTFFYSDCQFFVLDANYRTNPDVTFVQLGWLEDKLKEATDGVDDPKFIIAGFHQPAFSSGPHAWEIDQTFWVKKAFVSKFEKYGVDLVLNGHEHMYERSEKGGVVYITVGSGSGPRKKSFPFNTASKKLYTGDNTCMLVEVVGDTLTFTAINKAGTVVDEGTITK